MQGRHDHLALGRHGEDRVERWYIDAGCEVLARNWRHPSGEIDIIARDRDVLVICEVKTRSSSRFGSPFDAVGPQRQRRLRAAAAAWLRQHRPEGVDAVRFDVAAVTGGSVEVRTAAF